MSILKKYAKVAGAEVIENISAKADKLRKKHLVCISSTYQGGGVAEILNSVVILLNEIGVDFGWRILHGNPDFFMVTKKFHNGLQGEKINLSERKKRLYLETNRKFSVFTHIHHDLVMVHDPQPLPLISFYEKKQPWVFECHVDLSNPNPGVWNYLKPFIEKYDHFIVSLDKYKMSDLTIPQSVIYPAIDPLSSKNKQVSEGEIDWYMNKFGVDRSRPIISQVSRFDKWKDPVGVLKIFDLVRKRMDCQLVLLGQFASDDPEGQRIFQRVEQRMQKCKYKNDVILLVIDNNFLVNCLQRASSVVIQKSLKEGFGLTVSEALYKGTPVVASNVGGIPLQVLDGVNGFLHEPADYFGFSNSIIKLLKDEKLRQQMGKNGREHVRKNFLITRLMLDWLTLFDSLLTTQKKA
jgi:trehalose synthase